MSEAQTTSTKYLTTDTETTKQQIYLLDRFKKRGPLRAEEKRNTLRVFFSINRDVQIARERTGKDVRGDDRKRTAKLFGRGIRTVSNVIRMWNKARSSTPNSELEMAKLVLEDNRNGNYNFKKKK